MSPLKLLFSGQLPQLVMFDLDGTLLDSVPDLAAAVDKMLSTLGYEPAGVDKVKLWVGNGLPVLVKRALSNGDEELPLDKHLYEQAQQLFTRFYADQNNLTCVYPKVYECLSWLKQQSVKLALITNKPEQFLPALLKQHDLDRFFTWVVGGDSLPQRKPDPAQLLWVMQQAKVTAEQAFFVGDSCNDIRAAKAAGVKCAGLTYGYNHGQPISQETPQLVIDSLEQLIF